MDFTKLNRLIEAQNQRKDLEKQVEALKEEERQLMDDLIPQFEDAGVPRITIGDKTLYIKRELWAGLQEGFEHEDGVAALKAAGMDDLVAEKFNSRTVSSFFREREKQVDNGELAPEELVPAALRGVFTTNEKFSIGITKA